MEELTRGVIIALKEAGIDADHRFPAGIMPRLQKTYAAVEIQSLQSINGALGDYLGTVEQEDLSVAECYGRKVGLRVLVRLFAPSAAMLQASAQAALQALEAGVEGLRTEEISLEESRFDELCDCYVRDMHLVSSAYFYALSKDDGQSFYDFKLEGEFQ